MEQTWTEPLHEYGQFANIIKKILVYRHQKHAQYELTQEALESKRESLHGLEKSEAEARRLEQALSRASTINGQRSLPPTPISPSSPQGEGDGVEGSATTASSSTDTRIPPTPSTYGRRRGGSGYGFLNALSHSISGMMDVDPEVARRNSISKTRDSISQVWAFHIYNLA
jgi:sorting nexin-41/42